MPNRTHYWNEAESSFMWLSIDDWLKSCELDHSTTMTHFPNSDLLEATATNLCTALSGSQSFFSFCTIVLFVLAYGKHLRWRRWLVGCGAHNYYEWSTWQVICWLQLHIWSYATYICRQAKDGAGWTAHRFDSGKIPGIVFYITGFNFCIAFLVMLSSFI